MGERFTWVTVASVGALLLFAGLDALPVGPYFARPRGTFRQTRSPASEPHLSDWVGADLRCSTVAAGRPRARGSIGSGPDPVKHGRDVDEIGGT
jgi:hypothetical protein